jgi:hypothetical protein
VTLTRLEPGDANPELLTDWREPGPFDELIASWDVTGGRGVEIAAQGRDRGGMTAWAVLARRDASGWTSVTGQDDGRVRVEVDVLIGVRPLDAFRLRIRADGPPAEVRALAVCTTLGGAQPEREHAARAQQPGGAVEIPLRPRSQMAFRGLYPELDGGGASWCSPTSLAMVLERWGVVRETPEVARAVYDPAYGGCGNWSLNVAHAAALGLDAVVTRLASLAEARRLLEREIPLVVSIAAGPGELPGFPLAAGTRGHLVVLSGETAQGDPIVHDPAAAEAGTVRRVYPRRAFERAWLEGSNGTVYLVRPRDIRLPAGQGRW